LVLAGPAAAQQMGSITGRVVNAVTNAPVASAQVTIAETSIGTLSRADGRFLLMNVPPGTYELRVQSIGFAPAAQQVTVRAGEVVTVDLTMREEAVSLEEIVVTGVGAAARRREIGNSLVQIDMSTVEARPIENIETLLRGTTAGVQSLSVTGQVGGGGTLQLRGVKSVSQGNAPLIYVDGVRLSTSQIPPANLEDGRGPRISMNPLNEINPADIERIEIIKGAAATTLYGTEASGGVIQIFTKKGIAGAPQWSFSLTQGANFWPTLSETIQQHPTKLDLEQAMRTGWIQTYNGSVRGGTDRVRYYLSGTWSDEDGIVPTQWTKYGAVSGNMTFEPLAGVTVTWNNSYTHRRTRYVGDSNNRHAYILNVMRVGKGYWPGQRDNSWVLEQELLGQTDNFISGLRLEHVRGGIRNSVMFGLNHLEAANSGLLPFGYYLYPTGSIGVQRWRDRTLTIEYSGAWDHSLSRRLHSTLAWGGQVYDEDRQSVEASGLDFAGPSRVTISSAAKRSSSEERIREVNAGFFLQEKLGLDDRLFVTVGLRVDGSSTFGEDYGLQTYPKLSVSYVLSEAGFWPKAWWQNLRLRAAVGEAGKAPGAFDAVRTWDPVAGLEGQAGVTPNNLGNANLGPERTREIELGFDSEMLDSRLSVEFTYYNARTTDALFAVLPIPSSGFSGSQLRNVGEIRSHGIELTASAILLQSEGLVWGVGGNLTTTHSKVTNAGGSAPISMGYQQWVREGYAPPSFFGRRVTNPNEYADPIFEEDVFLGQTFPSTTLGVNTDVTIGGSLTLSAQGELSRGGHILNSTAYLNAIREIWPGCDAIQQKEKTQGIDALTAAERAKCLSQFTGEDQFIESGDFFKIRSITATFRIPDRWLPPGASSATLAITGQNLFKLTDYTGMDPEVIEGGSSGQQTFRRVDYYNFPPRRSIATKLSVTF
jgi:TonB-dependent SusC/RagA subfamily outer membrane receptor